MVDRVPTGGNSSRISNGSPVRPVSEVFGDAEEPPPHDVEVVAFRNFLVTHHRIYSVDALRPTDTPGYWIRMRPCAGAPSCREPIHWTLFNRDPTYHTVYYAPSRRDARGRWVSPYEFWRRYRAACMRGER